MTTRIAVDENGNEAAFRLATNPATGEEKWFKVDTPVPPAGNPVTNVMDAAVQGLTLGFSDELEAGIQAAGEALTGKEKFRASYDRNLDEARERMGLARSQNPYLTQGAEILGSFGPGGMAAKMMGMPTLLKTTLLGAGEGLVQGAGYAEDERLSGAAEGALLGGALGGATQIAGDTAGRLLNAAPDLISKFTGRPPRALHGDKIAQRNIDKASELGIKLTPYQQTGHKPLERIEANLKTKFGSGKHFDEMAGHNQQVAVDVINKQLELPQSTGVDLGEAYKKNQEVFDSVIAGEFDLEDLRSTPILLTQKYYKKLNDIEKNYIKGLGRPSKHKVIDDAREIGEEISEDTRLGAKNVLQVLSEKGKHMDPALAVLKNLGDDLDNGMSQLNASDYMFYYSQLSKDVRTASKAGDHGRVDMYSDLMDALDEAAEKSMDGEKLAKFRKARKMHQTRMTLERPGVVNPATGEVSIPSLANSLRQDTAGFVRGENKTPMYEMAKLHHAFKDLTPDTGSATKAMGPFDLLASPAYSGLAQGYLGLNPKLLVPTKGSKYPASIAPLAAGSYLHTEEENEKEDD